LRGTFLSMNGAVQQLASGGASYLGGAMIAADASGHIVGYGMVGYLAIAATLAAMVFVGQINLHTGTTMPGRKV
jgi:predicted MFS family arabinose efflux permease